ncbi:MAG: metallophosphoesterase, partial [Bacillota bacterium]|nr:metallophosphoesterase [Bacillota bacterium]
LFALGDLHLSLTAPADPQDPSTLGGTKPMDIFGDNWLEHIKRIYENSVAVLAEDDVLLIPGDISWAMTLEGAKYDLDFIGSLPGRKIMIRGNHDYWWHSPSKIRKVLPPSIEIIQNEAVVIGNIAVTGTRLWNLPGTADFKEEDEKIYRRELLRLEMSLRAAGGRPIVNMFHYMPTNELHEANEVTEILEKYNVEAVVYGHLHDGSHRIAIEGEHWGMNFHLVSADYLNCTPKFIREL